ncbi:MAG TPA: hypothetical protein VF015_10715 [Acidimicrobiales bacterium]
MIRDLVRRREAIDRAKEDLWSDVAADGIDPQVRASWRRCAPRLAASGLDAAPVDRSDTSERWDASPIRRAVPGVVEQLDHVAKAGDLIACITDADGRVLWQSTPRWLRPRADSIGLLPGGVWHEGTSGTNGIGLALAADRPSVVFATEHWLNKVRDWVCYGAPIHGPDGAQVGAIDLSTTWKHANPLALATVESLARLVEHELRLDQSTARSPAPALELRVLGDPAAALDGRPLRLTHRQFEILAILVVAGSAGLGELHAHLYGDRPVAVTTLKAEMSRLRRVLGGRLTSRPYRLTLSCRVDAVQLLERLDAGNAEGAARLYAGQLLPASEAPFLVEHRHHLDVALRTALLRRGTSAGVLRYSAVHPYDVEVLERARGLAAADDPLVPALTARLAVATSD